MYLSDRSFWTALELIIFLMIINKLSPVKIYPNFYEDRKQIRKDHSGTP